MCIQDFCSKDSDIVQNAETYQALNQYQFLSLIPNFDQFTENEVPPDLKASKKVKYPTLLCFYGVPTISSTISVVANGQLGTFRASQLISESHIIWTEYFITNLCATYPYKNQMVGCDYKTLFTKVYIKKFLQHLQNLLLDFHPTFKVLPS